MAKGEIRASYSTKRKSGSFKKSIKVYSNDARRPKAVLYISGNIVPGD